MKYEYFVSYALDNGFGCSSVILEQKIDRYELLLEIAKKITKDGNFNSQVIVLNFILLKEQQ
ncbi:hypothetical protein CDQ71_00060 [Campylobacter hyointestinalis subsp. hyointestinalis]|uniref:hypothetical protein n=1 Tax=Campylobacter hyointestinalis TaxID=198 RepID=UPI000CE46B34|nr:hypothetical protein [Campylobacter hyointestinalis]PPB58727.1 hypothetical protein CDQ71_00060 [Campylobacter hyointestinalis subsp. hyointestinalis]